jgi:hypothetical protein
MASSSSVESVWRPRREGGPHLAEVRTLRAANFTRPANPLDRTIIGDKEATWLAISLAANSALTRGEWVPQTEILPKDETVLHLEDEGIIEIRGIGDDTDFEIVEAVDDAFFEASVTGDDGNSDFFATEFEADLAIFRGLPSGASSRWT